MWFFDKSDLDKVSNGSCFVILGMLEVLSRQVKFYVRSLPQSSKGDVNDLQANQGLIYDPHWN